LPRGFARSKGSSLRAHDQRDGLVFGDLAQRDGERRVAADVLGDE
jgi:hypothetical protein